MLTFPVGRANCVFQDQDGSSPEKLWRVSKEDYSGANETLAKILLRLNPIKHKKLVDLIKSLDSEFQTDSSPNIYTLDSLEHEAIAEAQIILKKEWQRVKYGEPIYRFAKYLLIVIFVTGIITIFYKYVGYNPGIEASKI